MILGDIIFSRIYFIAPTIPIPIRYVHTQNQPIVIFFLINK